MKSRLILAISLLFLTAAFTTEKPLKIVLFGDSITQAGTQPGGYITLMQEILRKDGKSGSYELIGAGISGNKIYDLYLRAEADVLTKNPDVVVIWVGVNDVWHKSLLGTGTDSDKFEKFYRSLIKRFQEKGIKVIVCTPAAIGEKTDFTNQQDGDLNLYSNIMRNISETMNTGLLDLRKVFLGYNLENNTQNVSKGTLTTDGVHLNEKGNKLVAEQMLQALEWSK